MCKDKYYYGNENIDVLFKTADILKGHTLKMDSVIKNFIMSILEKREVIAYTVIKFGNFEHSKLQKIIKT